MIEKDIQENLERNRIERFEEKTERRYIRAGTAWRSANILLRNEKWWLFVQKIKEKSKQLSISHYCEELLLAKTPITIWAFLNQSFTKVKQVDNVI